MTANKQLQIITEVIRNDNKFCNLCKTEQLITNFGKDKTTKDGYGCKCNSCRKKYYKTHRERDLKRSKQYKIENQIKYKKYRASIRSEMLEYSNKYYQQNKEKIKQQNYLIDKNRTKVDPGYKLKKLLRIRINNVLKGNPKLSTSKKLLGCGAEEYKLYLERQFKPEMNWSNWGKIWEIDHIESCYTFDLTKLEEQQRCFHYTNTQPLFKTTKIAESFGYKNYIGNRNKSKVIY